MKTFSLIAFLIASAGLIFIVNGEEQITSTAQKSSDVVSREDSTITTDVKNKFAKDEKLRGLIMNVKTDKGIVTLAGTVNSQDQINRATEVAKAIPGVVSVETQLVLGAATVSGNQTPSVNERAVIVEKGQKELDEAADISGDSRIASEVQVKFAADDIIKSRNIRINSTDGVVTLRGEVRSAAEEEQAIKLANTVPGVREVQSQIVINPNAR